MIEEIIEITKSNIKRIRDKLITEINVEYPENEILYKSLLTKEYRNKIIDKIKKSYNFLEKNNYSDVDAFKKATNKLLDQSNTDLSEIIVKIENVINFIREITTESENEKQSRIYEFLNIKNELYEIEKHSNSQVIVVNGDGGTGKTHLLTNMANELLSKNITVIIFYGYSISSFKYYIEEKIKVRNLFEEIDKISKSNNEKGVIIFDAINEVNDDQENVIKYLIESVKNKNIKLIISYRNGDLEENALKVVKEYPHITLYGFADEIEAAVKFSEYYKIEINEILESNYANNPLILKIFCEQYGKKGSQKGQRGYNVATFIFEEYFETISKKIINELNITLNNGDIITGNIFWNNIAKEMAQLMVVKERTYLFVEELLAIIDKLNLNIKSTIVVEKLVLHKIIEYSYIYDRDVKEVYRFPFQRQSDFLITRYILNTKREDETWDAFLNKPNIIKM